MAVFLPWVSLDINGAYPFLQTLHISFYTTFLPFHSHLFYLCPSSHSATRTFQGTLFSCSTHFALPPLGRKWI